MPKKSAAPGAPYTVGYGRPPLSTRFRRGKSGNPGGRPKKAAAGPGAPPGLAPLAEATLRILSEVVPVRTEGGVRRVSGEEAILLAQRERALDGDLRSARFLLERWELAHAQAAAAQAEAHSLGAGGVSKMLAALTRLLLSSKALGFEDIDAILAEIERSAPAWAAARSADPGAEASRDPDEAVAVDCGEAGGAACDGLPDLPGDCGCEGGLKETDPSEGHGEALARPVPLLPVDATPASRRASGRGPLIQPNTPFSGPAYGIGGTARRPPGGEIFK